MTTTLDSRVSGRCPVPTEGRCELRSLGRFEDLSGKVGRVEVLRCRACGLGITDPPLADVKFLYEGRQSQDFQQSSSRVAHFIKRVAFRRQARRLLQHAACIPKRVLDFGCGSGLFTRVMGGLLPDAEVVGSDFESASPPDLQGRLYRPFETLGDAKGEFDLVIALHVLEHDDDAAGLLARIAAPLDQGGTLVLEVPNIDCVWTSLFGAAWDAWYVPFHRTHFTRDSLRAVVERAGMRVVSEHDVCVPSMGRSLSNVFGGDKGLFWLLVGIGLHPLQWLAEKLSRRPSALRIVARKVENPY